MHSLKTALDLVTPNVYMSSIDLSDAYFTVSIAQEYRKYLKFRWRGKLYQFTCIPNGLACAPRLFTRLLNSVFAYFRQQQWSCFQYIDDSIIIHPSFEKCRDITIKIAEILKKLGFYVHESKSCLTPDTKIVFLGFNIDSVNMTVTPTEGKINKICSAASALLQKNKASIREVAGVVGLAGAYSVASDYGANHAKNIEVDKIEALRLNRGNYDKMMYLSEAARDDLNWWLTNVHTLSKNFRTPIWDMTITTDASKAGWGAVSPLGKTNGRWNFIEKDLHINVLELMAVWFGLKSFIKTQGLNVRILSDNSTTVSYINKKGGVHSRACLKVSQDIWNFAEQYKLNLIAAHIPGKHNRLADMYSRKFKENTEWELNQDIFRFIVSKWGKPVVDLFASRLNSKCKVYMAWKPDPYASHIDAFSINWHFSFTYAFPPFCLVSRVWRKMLTEGVHGILVAPHWPGQPWFAALTQTSKDSLLFQRRRQNLVHPSPSMKEDHIGSIPLVAFLY